MSTHDEAAEQIARRHLARWSCGREAHDLPPTPAARQVSWNERRAHQGGGHGRRRAELTV